MRVSAAAPAWSIREVTDSIANGERTAVEVLDSYLEHVRSHTPHPTSPELCAVWPRWGLVRCEESGRSVPCRPVAPCAVCHWIARDGDGRRWLRASPRTL